MCLESVPLTLCGKDLPLAEQSPVSTALDFCWPYRALYFLLPSTPNAPITFATEIMPKSFSTPDSSHHPSHAIFAFTGAARCPSCHMHLLHDVYLFPSQQVISSSSELLPPSARVPFGALITLHGGYFSPVFTLLGVVSRKTLCLIHLNRQWHMSCTFRIVSVQ